MSIPLRQPLASVTIITFWEKPRRELIDLIKQEINVKEIIWITI
jgi:hypothetical protein